MANAIVVHRFGPFHVEAVSGRLFRDSEPLPLAEAHAAILLYLVEHAGQVVSRDTLATAGWGNAAIAENSVNQAISRILKALGHDRRVSYIDTVAHHGYRFTAAVERGIHEKNPVPVAESVGPFQAFIQGRRDLATLDRGRIASARAVFAEAIAHDPGFAPAHIGLGCACALAFESSYVDLECDTAAREIAVRSAHAGTTLAPASGQAWSVLALAHSYDGDHDDATAAAYKAVTLEPSEVRHWLRYGYVGWGELRLEAARNAQMLVPDLALGHWLTATVLIARGAFELALDVLRRGCAAQDRQSKETEPLPAVGLHLLHGLVLAAQDRLDEAASELVRELGSVDEGLLWGRECAANTWYSLGAVRRRQRKHGEAEAAFRRALEIAPGHLSSTAALGRPLPRLDAADPRVVDAAIAGAIALARAGRHAEAASTCRDLLESAASPAAGWILPVEPMLHATALNGVPLSVWADVLAAVRRRAT